MDWKDCQHPAAAAAHILSSTTAEIAPHGYTVFGRLEAPPCAMVGRSHPPSDVLAKEQRQVPAAARGVEIDMQRSRSRWQAGLHVWGTRGVMCGAL